MLHMMRISNDELKASVCKTKISYSDSSGACWIVIYGVASLPIRNLEGQNKKAKQTKQN